MKKDDINQMKEVLGQYSICYSDRGIRDNLDSYSRNKRSLITILRKHPFWIETAKAVVLEVTASREIDKDIVSSCRHKLYEMFDDLQACPVDDRSRFQLGLDGLSSHSSKLLPESEYLKNEMQEICHFQYIAGQKASKAINKFCRQYKVNEHSEYEAVFAKLADALNPLSIPRKAVLSVHPNDYLQMSGSNNSWTSCHNLMDGGYAGGTLSYMNDPVSMIFYTIDPGNESTALYNRPKITRTVFCYHGGILLQSRLYPSDDDVNQRTLDRMCVQSIFSTCLKKPNLWKMSQSITDLNRYIHTVMHPLHYRDYEQGFNFALSYLKAYSEYPSMVIGHNAFCLYCGDLLDHNHCNTLCEKCKRLIRCADCGTVTQHADGKQVDGRYYCSNCIAPCEHCESNVPIKELCSVHPTPSEEISVCVKCRDNRYFQCVQCGEYHVLTDQKKHEGQTYCLNCHAQLDHESGAQSITKLDFSDDLRRAS